MKSMIKMIVLLLLIMVSVVPVFAMNTGFSLENMSETEANAFLEKTDIQSLDMAPAKGNIISFNIGDDRIALAIEERNGYNRKFLCIYNPDGQFLKGYSFNTREFGMDFDGDVILIYFDNEDVAVSLSATGQVEEIYRIPYSENRQYWGQYVYARVRRNGDLEYRLQNGNSVIDNLSSPDYAQLIVTDSAGNERILYDNSASRNANNILLVVVLILLANGVGVTFVFAFRHGRKNTTAIF